MCGNNYVRLHTTPSVLTEKLFTSRDGFGITTATLCQIAACRIADGMPLGKLSTNPEVVKFVGGRTALNSLPNCPPAELCYLASTRSAKTLFALAKAVQLTQTVDVSGLTAGEVACVSIMSLTLKDARRALNMARGAIENSAVMSRWVDPEAPVSPDSITLLHPTGRPMVIEIVAGARAGGSLIGRWSAGVIFDEAARMLGSDDAIVNLPEAKEAVQTRILPGGMIIMISSPHAPVGPLYDFVTEHWTKPTEDHIVMRGTGPMLNPLWYTPAKCEDIRRRDPNAYTTDVEGEFREQESGLVSVHSLNVNTRTSPVELPYRTDREYCAAVDPSSGSASGNAWTLVVVEIERTPGAPWGDCKLRVAHTQEWRGTRPDECWREIALAVRKYALSHAYTDQYAATANQDLAARYGLILRVQNTTALSKLSDFKNLATYIHSDRLELSPNRTLRTDLLGIKLRVTTDGEKIVLPRTADGRHCDYAPALCAAVKNGIRADSVNWDDVEYLQSALSKPFDAFGGASAMDL